MRSAATDVAVSGIDESLLNDPSTICFVFVQFIHMINDSAVTTQALRLEHVVYQIQNPSEQSQTTLYRQ